MNSSTRAGSSSSIYIPQVEILNAMSRRQLQDLAFKLGYSRNIKTAEIIQHLSHHITKEEPTAAFDSVMDPDSVCGLDSAELFELTQRTISELKAIVPTAHGSSWQSGVTYTGYLPVMEAHSSVPYFLGDASTIQAPSWLTNDVATTTVMPAAPSLQQQPTGKNKTERRTRVQKNNTAAHPYARRGSSSKSKDNGRA